MSQQTRKTEVQHRSESESYGVACVLKFIVLVGELSGGYEAILVLVLLHEDVLDHALVMGVVGGVAVALELLAQVFLHLGSGPT